MKKYEENLGKFSDFWNDFNSHPKHEHFLFYQFLFHSPSYWLAHKLKTKEKINSHEKIPADIEAVLKTYELVGSVYDLLFEEWWEKRGYELFYANKVKQKLTLYIDLNMPKKEILEHINHNLESALKLKRNKNTNKIIFLVNKVRDTALFVKLRIIEEKANALLGQKKTPNWQIAAKVGYGSKHLKKIESNTKKTQANTYSREYLGMFVAKKYKEALYISENAARGHFPLTEPPKHYLDFNLSVIAKLLEKQELKIVKSLVDNVQKDIPNKQWEYSEAIIRKINKRKRREKRILKEAEKIVSKKL
jgi:hypothetical protein